MTKGSPAEIISEARQLHKDGLAAWCVSRQREARRLLSRSMALLDSITPVPAEHREAWAHARIRLFCTLAFTDADSDGVDSGLARIDEVRELVHDLSDPLLRIELSASVDHNRGLLLFGAGRNDESLKFFDSSLEQQEYSLSRTADLGSALTRMLNTLATRGLAYTRVGDVQRARADLVRAIAMAEDHDMPATAADVRRPLGNLELRTGDVPAAMRHYNESERVYRELGKEVPALLRQDQAEALLAAGLADEAGKHLDEVLPDMRRQEASRDLASVELFRATAALLSDDLDLARSLADSAEQLMRKFGCETCVANAAIIGLHADVLDVVRSGEPAEAAALSVRAVRVAQNMATDRLAGQAAVARLLAARLEIRHGDLRHAATLLDRVPRPGTLTPIDRRMLFRLCRAELAAANGHDARALTEIRTGLGELDKVRDRMGGLELVSATASHGQQLSELAIRLVRAKNDPVRLFDWLELTRAQTYRYEPLDASLDPELAERVAEVRSLTQSIHQAQHDGHATTKLVARRNERLRAARRLGWHERRWGKPRPVAGVLEVAQALGERALVSFVASEDSLLAVVLVDGDVRTVHLGSATQADKRARMVNVDLNALAPDQLPAPMARVVTASARKQADQVDCQIVRPLGQLVGDRDLVLVPTGALYAVPWGSLPSMHGRPVVVAPSATAWLAAERAEPRPDGHTVLVRSLGLPAAVGEIHKLGAHHRTARLISGQEATVAAVLKELDGAKLAHIAAHGAHEPENALFSRLELADGSLFAHEIAGLRQPPRQVVLAACELALNRIRPGDEALGFASALLASGAQTVIAPLSKVGDLAAAAAMDDYHRRLASGARPAVALAEAIAAEPLRRPFVCLGSSR